MEFKALILVLLLRKEHLKMIFLVAILAILKAQGINQNYTIWEVRFAVRKPQTYFWIITYVFFFYVCAFFIQTIKNQ